MVVIKAQVLIHVTLMINVSEKTVIVLEYVPTEWTAALVTCVEPLVLYAQRNEARLFIEMGKTVSHTPRHLPHSRLFIEMGKTIIS